MSPSCTIKDRCGPSGKECRADDRACQGDAVQQGLEILCESKEADPPTYVYCPTGTQARDSSVVWILLVVAFLIAAVGGTVFALVIRKRPS